MWNWTHAPRSNDKRENEKSKCNSKRWRQDKKGRHKVAKWGEAFHFSFIHSFPLESVVHALWHNETRVRMHKQIARTATKQAFATLSRYKKFFCVSILRKCKEVVLIASWNFIYHGALSVLFKMTWWWWWRLWRRLRWGKWYIITWWHKMKLVSVSFVLWL